MSRLRTTATFLLPGLAVALVAACAAEVAETTFGPTAVTEARHALVSVEVPSGRMSGQPETRFESHVHFAAYRGMALRTVASALDVWRPADAEGCVVLEPPAAASHEASLDLLSAGTVGLAGNGDSVTFEPRFLGAGPRLSGFTYAADASAAGPIWAAGEPYTVWASGDEVGPFAVTVRAPERVQLVAVAGRELGSASEVQLPAGTDLDIDLFAESETVFVSLRPLHGFGGPAAECRFGNIASVHFDAAELDAAFGPGAALEVTVRTAVSEPLPSGVGIAGEVLATVYDRVVVRR